MSDSVRPHPWDSPGENTGVGCHFLLQCIKVKSESEVAQSCLTLPDPMDCSPPGSSVHGIFQARVLEWGAIVFSNMRPQKKKKTVEGIWISWDSLLGIECQYHSHILTIKIHSLDLKDFLILDASRNLWIPIGGWVWCSQEHIGDYNHNTRATLWRGGIKNGYSVMQV